MPMNSTQCENDHEEKYGPQEEDPPNTLDGSSLRCFPAVRRSFRQKQSSWRWRWKYFTRALQPISEQGESTKDENIKTDDVSNVSTECKNNEENDSSVENVELEKSDNLDQGEPTNTSGTCVPHNDCNIVSNQNSTRKSKEDYSACIKLIEKFQEAVLDNAVRIIQAAFKRFRERRRFLKLRKAATVIQRGIRRWLQMRYLCLQPELQSDDCDSDHGIDMKESGLSSMLGASTVCNSIESTENNNKEQRESSIETKGHTLENEGDVEKVDSSNLRCPFENQTQTEQCKETESERSECYTGDVEQFDDSIDLLDLESSSDVNQMKICNDPDRTSSTGDACLTADPDSLSLTDSGIDICTDAAVETCMKDSCGCLGSDDNLANSLDFISEDALS